MENSEQQQVILPKRETEEFVEENSEQQKIAPHVEVVRAPALAPKPVVQALSAEPVPVEVENDKRTETQSTPVFIKMSGSNVKAEEAPNNNQIQDNVRATVQKIVSGFNDKKALLDEFVKRIQKLGGAEKERLKKNESVKKKVAPAEENEEGKAAPITTTLEDEADPKALSDEFRTKCEEKGLGLETIAWRDDDNSVKFEITKATNRDDLAVFEGYTVSISGLKDNDALVDFVSAVRVAGFEKAVEYMNDLGNGNKVELTLLNKEGKKIEGEELTEFKKLTVPGEQLENTITDKEGSEHDTMSDDQSQLPISDSTVKKINKQTRSDDQSQLSTSDETWVERENAKRKSKTSQQMIMVGGE